MKRFPWLSMARPCGECSEASVAGPPSPAYPGVPLPATVTIVAGLKGPCGSMRRTLWFSVSAM